MKPTIVHVPAIKEPIQPADGFVKKELASHKLDLLALCEFKCAYCSSNCGLFWSFRKRGFREAAERQLGRPLKEGEDLKLTFQCPDILDNLGRQLDRHRATWGLGKTLVFSMLTDAFSPTLVKTGVTREVLELLLEKAAFRIRVLTKNAIVGSRDWIRFFLHHPDRFVVGLSIGTDDNAWAKRVERGTSTPSARLRALHRLQDAGVPTFGMLCPVFPGLLDDGRLEALVDRHRPELLEHIWAEPYNDRENWEIVRDSHPAGSLERQWFDTVFADGDMAVWSTYATDLYLRLLAKADTGSWTDKLRYLLYETDITANAAARLAGLEGVLLQSKPDSDGRSQNPHVAVLQTPRAGPA